MQGKKLINDGIKKKKEKDCEEFSIEDEIKSQKKRMKGKGETEKKDDFRLPGTCWPKFRSVYLILSPLPDNGPGAAVMVIGYVLCVCGPVH